MNIIVELSNRTASMEVNNGEFETVFQPIIINQGDVIQVKNCFIDTIQQTYDQIYLPNDINFVLQLCYYEIDVPLFDGAGTENIKVYSAAHQEEQHHANYQMYLCFTGALNNRTLYTNAVNGTISAGLYTPNSLAIEITKQLTTYVSPQSQYPETINPLFTVEVQNTGDQTPMSFIHLTPGVPGNFSAIDYPDHYSYANLAETWLTGARQVAVVYNDQEDNKFQFKFLHTPAYDDVGNMTIKFYENQFPVTREAGCMFLDMHPKDFWQSLGFDTDKMAVTFNDYTALNPLITNFVNEDMTTEALLTIDDSYGYSFGDPSKPGYPEPGMNQRRNVRSTKISNNVRGISAKQFYSFKPLPPFLLVEFLTNFNGVYLTGNDSSKFINAIVSRNYTSNNYITGYSDSSITYEHKGESFVLSSIRTRILDPDTKMVGLDIGPNNYIILNIIKNIIPTVK